MKIIKTIKFSNNNKAINAQSPGVVTPKSIETNKKIDALLHETTQILFRKKNFFPFDLFPDEVIITNEKIDIIYNHFFFTKDLITILYENIYDVNVHTTLFFASLDIKVTSLRDDVNPVTFMTINDAITARRLIMGLVLAKRQKIDIKQIPPAQLKDKMMEIGKAHQK